MILPNVDWFQMSVDIKDYDSVCKGLLIMLEEKKKEAQELQKDSIGKEVLVPLRSRLNEPRWIEFKVQPNGAPRYAFILHNDSFEIKIAKFRSKSESAYPIQARIKSELLWSLGVNRAWKELENLLQSSFGKIKATKMSRIDLACHTDILNISMDTLERFKGNHIGDQIFREHRNVTGLSFGSRSTQKINVRIYDKTVEINRKRSKLWFFDIWKRHDVIDHVWNLEYEINRGLFKELEIETVEDALRQLKTLWRYCTEKHLVLTNNDATRIERATVDDKWIKIQNAYDDYEGIGFTRKSKQLSDDAEALIPGIIGCITSYASKLGMIDFDEILDEIKGQSLDYIEKRKATTIEDEIARKGKLIYR